MLSSNRRFKLLLPWAGLSLSAALMACVPRDNLPVSGDAGAGFWSGLWHGLVAPLTLILSSFANLGVYSTANSGLGYDAGFVIGLAVVVAGVSALSEGRGALFVLGIAGAVIAIVVVAQLLFLSLALIAPELSADPWTIVLSIAALVIALVYKVPQQTGQTEGEQRTLSPRKRVIIIAIALITVAVVSLWVG